MTVVCSITCYVAGSCSFLISAKKRECKHFNVNDNPREAL